MRVLWGFTGDAVEQRLERHLSAYGLEYVRRSRKGAYCYETDVEHVGHILEINHLARRLGLAVSVRGGSEWFAYMVTESKRELSAEDWRLLKEESLLYTRQSGSIRAELPNGHVLEYPAIQEDAAAFNFEYTIAQPDKEYRGDDPLRWFIGVDQDYLREAVGVPVGVYDEAWRLVPGMQKVDMTRGHSLWWKSVASHEEFRDTWAALKEFALSRGGVVV